MRWLAFCIALTIGLPVQAAPAQEHTGASLSGEAELDRLFARLKRESNERAAERIARRIQEEWTESRSATIDLMMQWSAEAMREEEFAVALDFLDRVVTLAPDYAEGWNRRATVHFMMDNYAKSMADIEQTLEIEPRHFGALSGMAGILKATGHEALALDAYRRILDVYPMMREAQGEVVELTEELTGDGI